YQTAKDIALDLKNLRQRMAFEEIRERSLAPDAYEFSGIKNSRETVVEMSRDELRSNASIPAMRPMSSAEYLITEIRKRKKALLITIVSVFLVAIGLTLFSSGFSPFSRNKAAIESIAVLPVLNDGGDSSSEYLADGMTESLIKNLSQLPRLKVMSKISV